MTTPAPGPMMLALLCVASRCRFVLVEIELDLAAMRVVEKELPQAFAHPALWQAAQLILQPGLFELYDGARQVGRGKRHVVDHAGPHFVELIAMDDMQDRLVADIEPIAGKAEIRPRSFLEAEQVAVEFARLLEVVAQHGEMVHALYAHAHLPSENSPATARRCRRL